MNPEDMILKKQVQSALSICAKPPCGIHQQARDTVLFDQVRGSNAALKVNYRPRLDQISNNDAMGRIAHLRGIQVECIFHVTTDGFNDAIRMRDLFGAFDTIQMKNASGHIYFQALNAQNLLDEQFMRFGRHVQAPYSYFHIGVQGRPFAIFQADGIVIPADSVELEHYVHVSMSLPFVAPTGLGQNQLEGLIPVGYLTLQGKDAFNLRISNLFPGVTGAVLTEVLAPDRTGQSAFVANAAPPNNEVGYDLLADIEYLPGVVIDRDWNVDSYQISETSGFLHNRDMLTQHASIRFGPTDGGDAENIGADNAGLIEGITLSIGPTTVMSALTANQAFIRTLAFASQNMLSGVSLNNAALDLPYGRASGVGTMFPQVVSLIPHKSYEYAASGPIHYKFANRNTVTDYTRFLQRVVACHRPENAAGIAETISDNCGCGSAGTLFGTQANGSLTTKLNPNQPLIYVPKSMQTLTRMK